MSYPNIRDKDSAYVPYVEDVGYERRVGDIRGHLRDTKFPAGP